MAPGAEEAALRAKIQAMKNLLEAKKRGQGAHAPPGADYSRGGASHCQGWAANRSWSAPPAAAYYHKPAGSASANKVWRREGTASSGSANLATSGSGARLSARVAKPKPWKQSLKVNTKTTARAMLVKRAQNRMQLQILKLEDGEYAKANGGFSLVRAGVKKVAPAVSTATATTSVGAGRKTISAGGVQYVVARGGKSIKRMTLLGKGKTATLSSRPNSSRTLTKTGIANAALQRAKASIQKARASRFAAKRGVVRTEYCRFYNRFGKCCHCNNKNDCKFIHDSRRIAMCRKFLRNECADPNCLLSHQNDENKVPVCSLFLRGACTREGCKYRHIKVSATAAVCADFVKGYCSKGAACPLRHELPSKKRAFSGVPKRQPVCSTSAQPQSEPNPTGKSLTPRVADPGAANSAQSAGPTGATPPTARAAAAPASANEELSIRPNIRFAPRHGAAFSALLDGL